MRENSLSSTVLYSFSAMVLKPKEINYIVCYNIFFFRYNGIIALRLVNAVMNYFAHLSVSNLAWHAWLYGPLLHYYQYSAFSQARFVPAQDMRDRGNNFCTDTSKREGNKLPCDFRTDIYSLFEIFRGHFVLFRRVEFRWLSKCIEQLDYGVSISAEKVRTNFEREEQRCLQRFKGNCTPCFGVLFISP